MMHWPDNPELKPDAREHAAVILEALGGDYVTALETLPVYLALYSANHVKRLEWLLTPQGEA